jgi:hypothetical protein
MLLAWSAQTRSAPQALEPPHRHRRITMAEVILHRAQVGAVLAKTYQQLCRSMCG